MKRYGWTWAMGMTAALLALVTLGAGPQARAAEPTQYWYDFEAGVKPWVAGTGSMLTLDRNDNLCPMNLGTGMALLTLPVQGAGAAVDGIGGSVSYMVATFPAQPGDKVEVAWAAKQMGDCSDDRCAPLIQVGPSADPQTFQWTAPAAAPGVDGWLSYRYKTVVAPSPNEPIPQIAVALGVSRRGALYGGALGIDCLRVTITRPVEVCPLVPGVSSAGPGYYFSLTPQSGSLAVGPGASFSYKLTLRNFANEARLINLAHESVQMWMEWKHELSATRVMVPACDTVDVYLTGVAPGLTPPQSNLVLIRATAGSQAQLASLKLNLQETH